MKNDCFPVAVCLIAIVLLAQGCASKWVVSGGPDSPTDGLSMQMLMEGQAQQMVRYRFNGEGVLLFAGGVDVALIRNTVAVGVVVQVVRGSITVGVMGPFLVV